MNQDASCCTLAYYTMQLALTVVGAAFLTELSLLEMAENNWGPAPEQGLKDQTLCVGIKDLAWKKSSR